MEWLDDLAGALPAPREDEPPDLRRRIIAELRDHLHAALTRELVLTGNAALAQQKVLARFGDPARLARKLWFDAMWEKIMTQRWMLAALVVMVVVSIGSMGLTWFLVVQAGQVNQALLEQNRAVSEIMLAKLATIGNSSPNSGNSMEWNSLKVQLSLEKSGGAPVPGVKIVLQGHLLDSGSVASLERTTGPDGVADFGLVRPGQHLLNVASPWGESMNDRHDYGILVMEGGQVVTVTPGDPQTLEIVCPSKPEETEIKLTVEWPDELAGRSPWLVCDFVLSPREIDGHNWTRIDDIGPRYVVVDPLGKLITNEVQNSENGRDQSSRSTFMFFKDGESFYADGETVMRSHVEASRSEIDLPGIYRLSVSATEGFAYPRRDDATTPHIWLPRTAAVTSLKWPAGRYSVAHFAVGVEADTEEEALPDDLLHPVFLGGIAVNIDRDDNNHKGLVRLLYPDERRASVRHRNRRGGKIEIPRFEAVAGRLNEWRLSLPQPLVDLLLEQPVRPERDADAPFDNLSLPNRAPQVMPDDDGVDPSSDGDRPRRSRRLRAMPDADDGAVDEDGARPLHGNPRENPENEAGDSRNGQQ